MSPERLSTVIRKLRTTRGLTQAALAKRAKVKKQYVTMLETGARKNPSLNVLKRIADALGVPVTELLEMMMDETDTVQAKLRTIRAFLEEVFSRLDVSPPSPMLGSGDLVWSFSVVQSSRLTKVPG